MTRTLPLALKPAAAFSSTAMRPMCGWMEALRRLVIAQQRS